MRVYLLSMLKRSLKYLLIAGSNAVVLALMLVLWADDVALKINPNIRLREAVQILGLTALILVGMLVLVRGLIKQHREGTAKKKIRYSVVLTLVSLSFFYSQYTVHSFNRLFNPARASLSEKMEAGTGLAYGTTAAGLSFEEYSILSDMVWFPAVPKRATEISYSHDYDGFLPDYSFSLAYTVPQTEYIKEMDYRDGRDWKTCSVEIIGDKQQVLYTEGTR